MRGRGASLATVGASGAKLRGAFAVAASPISQPTGDLAPCSAPGTHAEIGPRRGRASADPASAARASPRPRAAQSETAATMKIASHPRARLHHRGVTISRAVVTGCSPHAMRRGKLDRRTLREHFWLYAVRASAIAYPIFPVTGVWTGMARSIASRVRPRGDEHLLPERVGGGPRPDGLRSPRRVRGQPTPVALGEPTMLSGRTSAWPRAARRVHLALWRVLPHPRVHRRASTATVYGRGLGGGDEVVPRSDALKLRREDVRDRRRDDVTSIIARRSDLAR